MRLGTGQTYLPDSNSFRVIYTPVIGYLDAIGILVFVPIFTTFISLRCFFFFVSNFNTTDYSSLLLKFLSILLM